MSEQYIRFRETNNWEMERWRFYIPLRGNERAIRILADALKRLKPSNGRFVGEHLQYDIRLMPTPGDRVDRLCASSRGGYMAYYNKLEGRLDIRAARRAARLLAEEARLIAKDARLPRGAMTCRTVEDDLYKGGIRKMMRPWGRRLETTDWPTGRIRAGLRRTPISKWGDRLPSGVSSSGSGSFGFRRRLSLEERCWAARERLRDAGFRTVGDVADLTGKKLLATPSIGRETVNLTRWMLQEIGLDLAA